MSLLSGYENQCKDPMNNNKYCRVGQLTTNMPFIKMQSQLCWLRRVKGLNTTHSKFAGKKSQNSKMWESMRKREVLHFPHYICHGVRYIGHLHAQFISSLKAIRPSNLSALKRRLYASVAHWITDPTEDCVAKRESQPFQECQWSLCFSNWSKLG